MGATVLFGGQLLCTVTIKSCNALSSLVLSCICFSFDSVMGSVCNTFISYCLNSSSFAGSGKGALDKVSAIRSSFLGLYWTVIWHFWIDMIILYKWAGARC